MSLMLFEVLFGLIYEKELDNMQAKILFIYSFPKEHIND